MFAVVRWALRGPAKRYHTVRLALESPRAFVRISASLVAQVLFVGFAVLIFQIVAPFVRLCEWFAALPVRTRVFFEPRRQDFVGMPAEILTTDTDVAGIWATRNRREWRYICRAYRTDRGWQAEALIPGYVYPRVLPDQVAQII